MNGPLCCERIEVGLCDYLAGDLCSSLRLRFESHFAVCPECWNDLQGVRDLLGCLGELQPHAMPGGMKRRLVDARTAVPVG